MTQNNCKIENNRPICKGGLKGDGCVHRNHHITVCKDKLWRNCLSVKAIEAAVKEQQEKE